MNWRERRQRRELNRKQKQETKIEREMTQITTISQNLPSIIVTPPCEAEKTFPQGQEIIEIDPTRMRKHSKAGHPLNPIIHVMPYIDDSDED